MNTHLVTSGHETMVHTKKRSSLLMVAISWVIVLIPLGWGVVQSVAKSLPLFQMSASSE